MVTYWKTIIDDDCECC